MRGSYLRQISWQVYGLRLYQRLTCGELSQSYMRARSFNCSLRNAIFWGSMVNGNPTDELCSLKESYHSSHSYPQCRQVGLWTMSISPQPGQVHFSFSVRTNWRMAFSRMLSKLASMLIPYLVR